MHIILIKLFLTTWKLVWGLSNIATPKVCKVDSNIEIPLLGTGIWNDSLLGPEGRNIHKFDYISEPVYWNSHKCIQTMLYLHKPTRISCKCMLGRHLVMTLPSLAKRGRPSCRRAVERCVPCAGVCNASWDTRVKGRSGRSRVTTSVTKAALKWPNTCQRYGYMLVLFSYCI